MGHPAQRVGQTLRRAGLLLGLTAGEPIDRYDAEPSDGHSGRVAVEGTRPRRQPATGAAILTLRLHEHSRFVRTRPIRRFDPPALGDLDHPRRTFRAAVHAGPLHLLGRGTEVMDDVVFVDLLSDRDWRRVQQCREHGQPHTRDPGDSTPNHGVLREAHSIEGHLDRPRDPGGDVPPCLASHSRRRLPANC